MSQIALTGATGAIGSRVARALAADGHEPRLVVRDQTRLETGLHGLPCAVVPGGYADEPELRGALQDVDVLFLVSAAESAERMAQHAAAVRAARDAGVRRVVYTSFFGAAPDCTFTLGRDHHATEELVREAGLEFTFLRDNLYLDLFPLLGGEERVLRGPAGSGRIAGVARADVAAVAAAVLLDDAHTAQTYDLTGPQALTMADAAAEMTEVLGVPFSFVDETVEEAYASRAPYGVPQWQLDAWVSTYTAVAAGEMDGVSDDVPRILGRPALSLRDVLEAER
jgi:NAD(P)H dehydrogenase (quinone)